MCDEKKFIFLEFNIKVARRQHVQHRDCIVKNSIENDCTAIFFATNMCHGIRLTNEKKNSAINYSLISRNTTTIEIEKYIVKKK